MQKDSLHIKNSMDEKQIISFDIFDTLIARDTKRPEDIFDIVQETFNQISETQISDYRNIRVHAEQKARQENLQEEVTLEEIYASMDGIPCKEKGQLLALERKTEIEHCHRSEKGRDLYEYAQHEGKKIILVSDMYLDEKTIVQILDKSGYKDYTNLFVSSQYRLKKKTGHLFRLVVQIMDCQPGQILHIGDNPISDGLSAKRTGIKSMIL